MSYIAHSHTEIFGPTLQLHRSLMGLLWGLGINLSIFISLYSYKKYSLYLHSLFGIFVFVYSLASSLPILFTTGLRPQPTNATHPSSETLNLHYLVGLLSLVMISVQTLLGVGFRWLVFTNGSTMNILSAKKLHGVFGYMTAIICKINIYVIFGIGNQQFWICLIIDIISIALLVIRKKKFSKLEQIIIPQYGNHMKSISIIKDLVQQSNYVIFGNYLFSIQNLKLFHPAGFGIIQSVKNRQIDRFMLGMETSQILPNTPLHSHSFKSLDILGNPIAKLTIPLQYSGFLSYQIQQKLAQSQLAYNQSLEYQTEVQIMSLRLVCKKSQIYQMQLCKRNQLEFKQKNINCLDQLGRYFSLSVEGKVMRLYCKVNFIGKNKLKLFLEKEYPIIQDKLKKTHIYDLSKRILFYKNQFCLKHQPMPVMTKESKNSSQIQLKLLRKPINQSQYQSIPILFKSYPNGRMTQHLIALNDQKLHLSCQKGRGLCLSMISSGKILIVTGGTGIFPFLDLINLLYYAKRMQQNSLIITSTYDEYPFLQSKPFQQFNFHLMAAFSSIQQIHPVTLTQLLYLCQFQQKFTLSLKLKQKCEFLRQGKGLKLFDGFFQQILKQQLCASSSIAKIIVCGPPKMDQAISQFIMNGHYRHDILHIL